MTIILDIGLFVGRFHPVIVHLPIGFLLLAVLMEIYNRISGPAIPSPAISFGYFMGFLSGSISVILGFIISSDGGYDIDLLLGHKIAGIMVTLLALFCWILKSGKMNLHRGIYNVITGLLILLLILTGHLGGMLTHGKNYLISNAPPFLKKVLNAETSYNIQQWHPVPDSVIIYSQIIQPVLEKKCNGCHNSSKKKSGLELNTYPGLMKGGDNGPVILPGNSTESPLFNRVTLPPSDPKYMPPTGDHLNYGDIRFLKWWIDEGAPQKSSLGSFDLPQEIMEILLEDYGYDASPKSFLEIHKVQAVERDIIQLLVKNHFKVVPISRNTAFLDIRFDSDSISGQNLESILKVSEQAAWLDLRNCILTDPMMETIGKLYNLTKLRLDGNPVSDTGIRMLDKLEHLEVISLYGTEISITGLRSLLKYPNIKKIYIGQTKVNPQEITEIPDIRQDIEIVAGLNFDEK